MSIRVAYGPKSGIDSAIRSGEIPKGCLIVTKTNGSDSEFMFYDTTGVTKGISTASTFASQNDLAVYLSENEVALRGATDMAGRVISVLESGTYVPYLLQGDGSRTTLQTEAYISSVNGNQFKVTSGKLALNNVPISKVTGLAEALEEINNGVSDLDESLKDMARVATVCLNGVALVTNPEDHSVDIPLATASTLGLVQHSEEINKISICDDGTMKVGAISFDCLVDTQDCEVVFCCGNALRE